MEALQATEIFSILQNALPAGHKSNFIGHGARLLERLLGLEGCADIYRAAGHHQEPALFMRQVLTALSIQPVFEMQEAKKIPRNGPCVVVSNHPFGGIDGIILAELLLSIRPDVKILVNGMLNRIPQLRAITIAVNPFQSRTAKRANLVPIRNAMGWVKDGGMLLTFPAGEVSHMALRRPEVADPIWQPVVARIVRFTRAPVVPVFFTGRNRFLFQLAGLIHPRLRTILLARELLAKRGSRIAFKIGNPIAHRWLAHYADDTQMMDYLRWRTYIMSHASRQSGGRPILSIIARPQRRQPLAAAQPKFLCRRNIAALSAHQCLVQSGTLCVWQARAHQIPHLLHDIGRLRENAFRLAGEGTGRALDIDRFDDHYVHLFIWDDANSAVIGAYRLGPTDQIIDHHGKKGLYTSTLFHTRPAFYQRLGPALELGRSFVHPEHQKSYAPLLLLWKGIGAYVALNPRYRMLFGPVSISKDYSELSRRLMATTLLRHSQADALSVLVRPRKPARLKPIRIRGCEHTTRNLYFQDLKEIGAVVADIELNQKEVPVLLRQYLNLGGQLLAFNIDKHFNGVLDGLIVVDLLQTGRRTLARYMGTAGLNAFLAFHENHPAGRSSLQQTG